MAQQNSKYYSIDDKELLSKLCLEDDSGDEAKPKKSWKKNKYVPAEESDEGKSEGAEKSAEENNGAQSDTDSADSEEVEEIKEAGAVYTTIPLAKITKGMVLMIKDMNSDKKNGYVEVVSTKSIKLGKHGPGKTIVDGRDCATGKKKQLTMKGKGGFFMCKFKKYEYKLLDMVSNENTVLTIVPLNPADGQEKEDIVSEEIANWDTISPDVEKIYAERQKGPVVLVMTRAQDIVKIDLVKIGGPNIS